MAVTNPTIDNLKLWMKLNDTIELGGGEDQSVINEVGDNGTFINAPASNGDPVSVDSGNPPYLNGAFNLDGTNQHITVPDSAALSITGDLSISFWMKRDADNALENLICKGITDGQRSYLVFSHSNGTLYFWITATGDAADREYCVTGDVLADSGWQHIVVTYDADGDSGNGFMRAYIDGTETAFQANKSDTLPSSIHDSTEDLYIAHGHTTNYFAGRHDNIMIFDKVLTQAEVNWLYNQGVGREQFEDDALCVDDFTGQTRLEVESYSNQVRMNCENFTGQTKLEVERVELGCK